MKFHLNELKGRDADAKKPSTWDDISDATGIRKATLIALAKGDAKMMRPEYLDALCGRCDSCVCRGSSVSPCTSAMGQEYIYRTGILRICRVRRDKPGLV